jgi:hypothetical protein
MMSLWQKFGNTTKVQRQNKVTDLSIILPSIYPDRVKEFHNTIKASCKTKQWELIVVGPHFIEDLENTRFIQDWGNVSRCVQIGSMFARGEYLTWNSDDGLLNPGSYSDCLDYMRQNAGEKDGMVVRYFEAKNRQGSLPDDNYWRAHTHADQRLPGIPDWYMCAPVGLYKTQLWRELGGTDCRFMHQNLNSHDFSFRVQYNGGVMHLSPGCVMQCNFDNVENKDHRVLDWAYATNDRPLFQQIYSNANALKERKVDYLNWMNQPSHWERYE